MKILKTLLRFSDEDGDTLHGVDTISYQQKMWLVPGWIDHLTRQWKYPVRIISMDNQLHQKVQNFLGFDYILNGGISKSVFDGQTPPPPETQYVVIEAPDIRLEYPSDVTQ